jgi:chromosome segregation ATPase
MTLGKTLDQIGDEILKATAALQTEIVDRLLPDTVGSMKANDIMRRREAFATVGRLRDIMAEPVHTMAKIGRQQAEHWQEDRAMLTAVREELAKAREEHAKAIEAARVTRVQLETDLRAAREGRGIYESAQLKEAQAEATRQRQQAESLALANDAAIKKQAEDAELIASLQQRVKAQAEEAQNKAQDLSARDGELKRKLTSAHDLIEDRYGNAVPPFLALIFEEIKAAISLLK